jgi:hypothetical protein
MKKKTHAPNASIYPYIVLSIIFICIIYLITLRQRVEEFFTNNQENEENEENNSPENYDKIYIKKDVNAFEIEKVWEGKITNGYLSFWQRKNKKTQDLYTLGQFAIVRKDKLEALPDTMISEIPILSYLVKGGKFPISYVKIWSSDMLDDNTDIKDFSIWQPVPPEGYVAMGDIVVPSLSKPTRSKMICIPKKDTNANEQIKSQIFEYNGQNPMTIWNIGNYMSFMVNASREKPIVRQKDIVEINTQILDRHEPDPNEIYNGLKVIMKTGDF